MKVRQQSGRGAAEEGGVRRRRSLGALANPLAIRAPPLRQACAALLWGQASQRVDRFAREEVVDPGGLLCVGQLLVRHDGVDHGLVDRDLVLQHGLGAQVPQLRDELVVGVRHHDAQLAEELATRRRLASNLAEVSDGSRLVDCTFSEGVDQQVGGQNILGRFGCDDPLDLGLVHEQVEQRLLTLSVGQEVLASTDELDLLALLDGVRDEGGGDRQVLEDVLGANKARRGEGGTCCGSLGSLGPSLGGTSQRRRLGRLAGDPADLTQGRDGPDAVDHLGASPNGHGVEQRCLIDPVAVDGLRDEASARAERVVVVVERAGRELLEVGRHRVELVAKEAPLGQRGGHVAQEGLRLGRGTHPHRVDDGGALAGDGLKRNRDAGRNRLSADHAAGQVFRVLTADTHALERTGQEVVDLEGELVGVDRVALLINVIEQRQPQKRLVGDGADDARLPDHGPERGLDADAGARVDFREDVAEEGVGADRDLLAGLVRVLVVEHERRVQTLELRLSLKGPDLPSPHCHLRGHNLLAGERLNHFLKAGGRPIHLPRLTVDVRVTTEIDPGLPEERRDDRQERAEAAFTPRGRLPTGVHSLEQHFLSSPPRLLLGGLYRVAVALDVLALEVRLHLVELTPHQARSLGLVDHATVDRVALVEDHFARRRDVQLDATILDAGRVRPDRQPDGLPGRGEHHIHPARRRSSRRRSSRSSSRPHLTQSGLGLLGQRIAIDPIHLLFGEATSDEVINGPLLILSNAALLLFFERLVCTGGSRVRAREGRGRAGSPRRRRDNGSLDTRRRECSRRLRLGRDRLGGRGNRRSCRDYSVPLSDPVSLLGVPLLLKTISNFLGFLWSHRPFLLRSSMSLSNIWRNSSRSSSSLRSSMDMAGCGGGVRPGSGACV